MADRGVFVLGTITNRTLDEKTVELMGIGEKLAGKMGVGLSGVFVGNEIAGISEEAARFGPDKVYKLEHPLLEGFNPDLWVKVLEDLCLQLKPRVFIMLHSMPNMEVAPRLAYRLKTALTMDCTDLDIDEDGILLRTKPVYGGNAIAVFKYDEEPQVVTVRGNVMEPAKRRAAKGEIVSITPDLDGFTTSVVSIQVIKEQAISLEKADVIVAGGRGIGSAEGFKEPESLATALRGSFHNVQVGCTRPAVDSGWMPSHRQIGLSAAMVAPDLYIAVGISGAIQHLVGMIRSKKIVAVNTDSDCNIFRVADYGVVGDYKQVIPALKRKWEELS